LGGRLAAETLDLPQGDAGQGDDSDDTDEDFLHFTGMVCTPSPVAVASAGGVWPALSAAGWAGSVAAWPDSAAMLAGVTIWNNFTTLLTPSVPASTLAARSPSASVTLPIR